MTRPHNALYGADAAELAQGRAREVYLRLMEPSPPDAELEAQRRMLAHVAAVRYERQTGLAVSAPDVRRHPELPFLASDARATPDGPLLVCLSAGAEPDEAALFWTAQHDLFITGGRTARVVIFRPLVSYRHYTVERDRLAVRALLEKETEFWYRNVLQEISP